MKIYLVVFNDGFTFRVEEGWFDGKQANERAAHYNGEDGDFCGPYEVQEVDIYDSPNKPNKPDLDKAGRMGK